MHPCTGTLNLKPLLLAASSCTTRAVVDFASGVGCGGGGTGGGFFGVVASTATATALAFLVGVRGEVATDAASASSARALQCFMWLARPGACVGSRLPQ